MEESLFSWGTWDQHDTLLFSYSEVKLKKNIGTFRAGHEFYLANINYETGDLEFYNEGEDTPALKAKLSFKVEVIS